MKTRFLKPVLLAAAASLALAACATSPPYQPVGTGGARGGYAEQRLENDRFRVSFAGNSVTSREQVEMSLLLRSAELTKQNGFDWFATVNRATDRDTRYQTLGGVGPYSDPFYGSRYGGYWGPSWRFYGGGWSWGAPGAVAGARASMTGTSARSTASKPRPRSSWAAAPSPPATPTPSTPARSSPTSVRA
jgi:hypothetical protein